MKYTYLVVIVISCLFGCSNKVDEQYKEAYCKCIDEQINNSIKKWYATDFDLLSEARSIEKEFFKMNTPDKAKYLDIIKGNTKIEFKAPYDSLVSKGFDFEVKPNLVVVACPILSMRQLPKSEERDRLFKGQEVFDFSENEITMEELFTKYLNSISDNEFKSIEFRVPVIIMTLKILYEDHLEKISHQYHKL